MARQCGNKRLGRQVPAAEGCALGVAQPAVTHTSVVGWGGRLAEGGREQKVG